MTFALYILVNENYDSDRNFDRLSAEKLMNKKN